MMMKHLLVIFLLVVSYIPSYTQDIFPLDTIDPKAPFIEFETMVHDFGTIDEGSDASFIFMYKNTGKRPLILENVRVSCGCTSSLWSDSPVKKRKTGQIKISFDTSIEKQFEKTLTVYSNAINSPVRIVIKGNIIEKEQNPKSEVLLKKKALSRPFKNVMEQK